MSVQAAGISSVAGAQPGAASSFGGPLEQALTRESRSTRAWGVRGRACALRQPPAPGHGGGTAVRRRRCNETRLFGYFRGRPDQFRALFEHSVASARQWRVDRAGQREHVPPHSVREACGDERPGASRPRRSAPHRPALRSGGCAAGSSRRAPVCRAAIPGPLPPPGRDLPREQWMSGRVDGAGAGADHRDRAAAAGQRATMRRPVDARCRAVTQPPARLATVRARTARRPPRPAAWHYGCRPPRRPWHATVRASLLYREARVDRASSARQADRPGRRA